MHTIGLISGTSWKISSLYYQILNEEAKKEYATFSTAPCLLYSPDFTTIIKDEADLEWDKVTHLIIQAAQKLESAGATVLFLCSNRLHKVVPYVQTFVSIPFVHIADTVAAHLVRQGLTRVALFGTREVMEETFYVRRIQQKGIEVMLPSPSDREKLHTISTEELGPETIHPASKQTCLTVAQQAREKGAQGLVLGCEKLPLLLKQEQMTMPLLDATLLHAQKAARFALQR